MIPSRTVLRYRPTLSSDTAKKNLSLLLTPGPIRNERLDRYIDRLGQLFQIYAARFPHGLWDPGLVVTNEMRSLTELYLPMAELSRALDLFLALALRCPWTNNAGLNSSRTTWLDFLHRMRNTGPPVDPSALLKRLAVDEDFRIRFLFTLFLPRHHGGSFRRYPVQLGYIQDWLKGRPVVSAKVIRCLDAACGTGEGAYDLAGTLLDSGIAPNAFRIDASTLEPIEVFAAAHGFFPHDRERQTAFRASMEEVLSQGCAGRISFFQDNVIRHPRPGERRYDLVLCNGLLGGPFLSDDREVAEAISSLAGRLRQGGLLAASDRFHGGWKKGLPTSAVRDIAQQCGLHNLPVPEGIVAIKK
jgi:chemotaxis methyl-accepting protein methylase